MKRNSCSIITRLLTFENRKMKIPRKRISVDFYIAYSLTESRTPSPYFVEYANISFTYSYAFNQSLYTEKNTTQK